MDIGGSRGKFQGKRGSEDPGSYTSISERTKCSKSNILAKAPAEDNSGAGAEKFLFRLEVAEGRHVPRPIATLIRVVAAAAHQTAESAPR